MTKENAWLQPDLNSESKQKPQGRFLFLETAFLLCLQIIITNFNKKVVGINILIYICHIIINLK